MTSAYRSANISLYPHHDRPYARGETDDDDNSRADAKNKANLSISTVPATIFEIDRSGAEALSPIQEVSPSDEGCNEAISRFRTTSTSLRHEPSTRRLYKPRHQRLDFTRSAETGLRSTSERPNRFVLQQPAAAAAAATKAKAVEPEATTRRAPPSNLTLTADAYTGDHNNSVRCTQERTALAREHMREPGKVVHELSMPESVPTRTTRDVKPAENVRPAIEQARKPPDMGKRSNARYDFLHGAVTQSTDTITSHIQPQKSSKSYFERLADLEEIEKSGQDLLHQLAEAEANEQNKDGACNRRRARDTIFVANTINEGRQTINSIKASMHEEAPVDIAANDRSILEEEDISDEEDSGDEIDWSLGLDKSTEKDSSSLASRPVSGLYCHKNISISDYLREIETSDDVRSDSGPIPDVHAIAECASLDKSRTPSLMDSTSDSDQSSGASAKDIVPEHPTDVEDHALEIRSEVVEVPPDSPTFVDFDMPRTRQAEAEVDTPRIALPRPARDRSQYKHRRTSSFYGDHWHLDPDNAEGAASIMQTMIDEEDEALQIQKAEEDVRPENSHEYEHAHDEPNHDNNEIWKELVDHDLDESPVVQKSRRRSKSAPVRYDGSVTWRRSIAMHADEVPIDSQRISDYPVHDQKRAMPVIISKVDVIKTHDMNDVRTQREAPEAKHRESAMSELVITREDALGIFPPFRNRLSIVSRRESKGNVLNYMAPMPTHQEQSRPSSTIARNSFCDNAVPLTAVSESYMARIPSSRGPLLKKKNVRKLKISTPTLMTSSSNFPTVDLQSARLIHTEPHLVKTNPAPKSRSRLRDFLGSNKSKTNLVNLPSNTSIGHLSNTRRESQHTGDYSGRHRHMDENVYHPEHRRPVNTARNSLQSHCDSRLQSPVSLANFNQFQTPPTRDLRSPDVQQNPVYASCDGRF